MIKNEFFNIKRIKIVLNTNVKNEREMTLTGNMFNFKDRKINTAHPYFSDRYVYDQNALNELSLNKYSEKVYIFFDKSKFQEFLRKSKVADDTEKKNMYSKDGFIHKNIMVMLNAFFPISFPINIVPMAIIDGTSFGSTINSFSTSLFNSREYTHLKNKYTVSKVVWLNTLNSNPVYYRDFNEDLYIYLEKYKDAIKGKIKIIEDETIKINTKITEEEKEKEIGEEEKEKNEKLLNMFLRVYTLRKYINSNTQVSQLKSVLFDNDLDTKMLIKLLGDDQYKQNIIKAYSQTFNSTELLQLLQDNILLHKGSSDIELDKDQKNNFKTENDAIVFLNDKLLKSGGNDRITEAFIKRKIEDLIQKNIESEKKIEAQKYIFTIYNFINSINTVIENIKNSILTDNTKSITTIIDENKHGIIELNKIINSLPKSVSSDIIIAITKISNILKLILSLNEIKTYEKYREINETDFYNTFIRKEKYYDLISQKYSKLLMYIKSTNPAVDSALTSGILNIPDYLVLINSEDGKGAYVGVDEIIVRETDETKPSFQIELYTELIGGIVTNETHSSLECQYENNYLGNRFEKLFYNINSSNQLITENKFVDLTNDIKKIKSNPNAHSPIIQNQETYDLSPNSINNAYKNIFETHGNKPNNNNNNNNNFKINLETILNKINLNKLEHTNDITDPNNKIQNQTDIETQLKNERYGLKNILSDFDERNEDPKKNKAFKSRMNKIISDIQLNIKQKKDDLTEYKKKGTEIPQKIYLELYRDDLYEKISQDLFRKISENEEKVIGGSSHNLTKHRRLRCKKRKTLRKNTK